MKTVLHGLAPVMRLKMLKAKYLFFMILCLWSLGIQLRFRIVGDDLVPFLPWIGIGLGVMSAVLFLNYFLLRIPADHSIRRLLRWVDWGASIVVILFVGYSLSLYANAAMIQSAPVPHQSEILSISGGQIDLGVTIPYAWVTLRSWDKPGETRNVLISERERWRFWGGEAVVVHVRDGAFGKPWVMFIEQDEDHYARAVLALTPTAAKPWRDLISGYLAQRQWGEAADNGRKYLEVYPADYSFAHNMGTSLVSARYANDRIFFLKHIIDHQPDYENYQLLGFAYLQAGQTQKAVEMFRASIPLKPKDWEAYYHLGLIDLEQLGKYQEAIDLFDQVLQFIPNFPMIERYRADAQQRLVAQTQKKIG